VSDTGATFSDYYSGAICRTTVYLKHVCSKHHSCYLSIFTLLSLFWNEKKMWGITFRATYVYATTCSASLYCIGTVETKQILLCSVLLLLFGIGPQQGKNSFIFWIIVNGNDLWRAKLRGRWMRKERASHAWETFYFFSTYGFLSRNISALFLMFHSDLFWGYPRIGASAHPPFCLCVPDFPWVVYLMHLDGFPWTCKQ
jgi:hypothetical protein